MTIAAGFMCADGIVLSADTQETIPGYIKAKTEKISLWSSGDYEVATTGSGDSALVAALTQRIIEIVENEVYRTNPLSWKTIEDRVGQEVLRFFNSHILPYARDERPPVDLLIAMHLADGNNLIKASNGVVHSISPSVAKGADCIGSGILFGNSLIERFYSPFLDLDELVIVAMYVIFQGKKWVDGCGGNTDIAVFPKSGGVIGLASSDIEQLEKMFAKCDDQFVTILQYIANFNRSESDALLPIKWTRKHLLTIRKECLTSAEMGAS